MPKSFGVVVSLEVNGIREGMPVKLSQQSAMHNNHQNKREDLIKISYDCSNHFWDEIELVARVSHSKELYQETRKAVFIKHCHSGAIVGWNVNQVMLIGLTLLTVLFSIFSQVKDPRE